MKKKTDCERFGHEFSRSKSVDMDAWGVKKKRVRYCSFCGEEKPPRQTKKS